MKKVLSFLLLLTILLQAACGFADGFRIPEGVRFIEEEAFAETNALDTVILPQTSRSISSRAFADSGLKSIYIPDECMDIAEDAFEGCTDLLIITDRFNTIYYYAEDHGIATRVLSRENNLIEDPEYENGVLSVSVTTDQEAFLVYSLGTNTTGEDFYTDSILVDAHVKNQRITLKLPEDMPEFFELKACLWGDEFRHSDYFRTIKFTSRYKAFETQTIDDYANHVTMNFGGGNYAALVEGARNATGLAQCVGAGKYVMPAECSPKTGDVFLVLDERGQETPIRVKTATRNNDGSYQVTDDPDATLADLYDSYRINMNAVGSSMVSDENANDYSVKEFSFDETLSFPNVDISASGSVKFHFDFAYNKKFFGDDYYEYSTYAETTGTLKIDVKAEIKTPEFKSLKLAEHTFAGIKGLAELTLTISVPFSFSCSAGFTVTGTWTAKNGVRHTPDGPTQISDFDFKPNVEGTAELSGTLFGIRAEIKFAILKDLFAASLVGEISEKVKASLESDLLSLSAIEEQMLQAASSIHGCQACISGGLTFVASADVKITSSFIKEEKKDKNGKTVKDENGKTLVGNELTFNLIGTEVNHCTFYISVVNSRDSLFKGKVTFGLGDCPNHRYRTEIATENYRGLKVKNIPITVYKVDKKDKSKMDETKFHGVYYLYPGDYLASAAFCGGDVEEDFSIATRGKNLTLKEIPCTISGTVTDNMTDDPVVGAVVTVKLKDQDTIVTTATTDQNGHYSLEIGGGDYLFEFTDYRYDPKEIPCTVTGSATLDAAMKGHYHSVSFYIRGGNDLSSVTVVAVLQDNAIEKLPEPYIWTGSRFVGWNTSPDGSGTEITEQTVPTENMTCYAVFSDSNFYMGHLGNDTTYRIEWMVLDEQDGKLLLLSKLALAGMSFGVGDARWENSDIRYSLNNNYINKWFTEKERARILTTDVDNSASQGLSGVSVSGSTTQDKLFLLSVAEVEKYFPNKDDRACQRAGAAKDQIDYVGSGNGRVQGNNYCDWWLRSPGKNSYGSSYGMAAYIDVISINPYPIEVSTVLSSTRVNTGKIGIRPAMWVKADP